MQSNNKIIGNIFIVTAVLGILVVSAEIVFQSFGKTICPTEGCKLVSQHTRFGDISILLIGLATFSALTVLSYLALYKNKPHFNRYINIILIIALAAEGFFIGYQAFSIRMACVFCLIMLAFFMVLGMLRLLYGEKDVIAGFLSFAAVFSLFYLILPAGGTVRFPEEELILFYSKDCKYCAEIMREIETSKIKVAHLNVGEYAEFLKSMGIQHVPTLFVNKKYHKLFLTGKEEISKYLFADQLKNNNRKEKSTKPAPQIKKKTGDGLDKNADIPSPLPTILFEQPNSTVPFFIPPADNGMCKETEKTEECE